MGCCNGRPRELPVLGERRGSIHRGSACRCRGRWTGLAIPSAFERMREDRKPETISLAVSLVKRWEN